MVEQCYSHNKLFIVFEPVFAKRYFLTQPILEALVLLFVAGLLTKKELIERFEYLKINYAILPSDSAPTGCQKLFLLVEPEKKQEVVV